MSPWPNRVAAVTVNAISSSTSRCSKSSGMTNAAASVTTPRIPAHEVTAAVFHDGTGRLVSPRVGARRTSRKAKIQIGRSRTVAAIAAAHTPTIRPRESVLSPTSAKIHRACRPISRNTVFSSRNEIVRQLSRSEIRDEAVCSTGALCPSSRPATTTASTPEAWISSATTYAANGVSSETLVSSTGSVTCRRTKATSA